jgi:LysR family glycine cleavage system transcriptional activator
MPASSKAPGQGLRRGTGHLLPGLQPVMLAGRHPIRSQADLCHHQLIHDTSMASEPCFRTWRHWYERASLPVTESERGLHINDSAAAFRMAISGRGVALGRTTLVEKDLVEHRLVHPFGPPLECTSAYYVCGRGTNPLRGIGVSG